MITITNHHRFFLTYSIKLFNLDLRTFLHSLAVTTSSANEAESAQFPGPHCRWGGPLLLKWFLQIFSASFQKRQIYQ